MQVGSKLSELSPCALFLALLLLSSDLAVVVVKVAAHFLVLRLNVLQVLLASVEVVLPSSAVVTAIAVNILAQVSVCLSNCGQVFI